MNHAQRKTMFVVSSITLMAMLSALQVTAQDWVTQSPSPADVDLLAVHFVSPEVGWITGRDDLLMMTTDGGQTWEQTGSLPRDPQFSEDPLWDVEFVDAQHGFAFGNFNLRTTNGGRTWQQIQQLGSVSGMDFLTPQFGYAWTNLAIYRTQNAGDSFTMIWDWRDFNFIADVDFFDENTGLVVGERDDVAGVFRTTDRGNSWQRISNEAFGEILYITRSVVIAARQARFYRSTDGGVSWTLVHDDTLSGTVNSIESLTLIDADSVAAVGFDARIWVSDDSGRTWVRTKDALGGWGFGWDIQFADASTGYAVGRLGMIFKSTDGGHSWRQISHGAAVIIDDLEMLPTGVGIAVGQNGTVLRTTDFGGQWLVQPQLTIDARGVATDLHDVQAIDNDTFVVVGDGGGIWRSDDAGVTFRKMGNFSFDRDFFSVSFINESDGWLFGRWRVPFGVIARTRDGGETWQVLHTDVSPAEVGHMFDENRGVALFPQTIFASTTDGFVNLRNRQLPSGDSFQSMAFANPSIGWVVGFFGDVRKTDDGGVFFDRQTLPGFRWQDGDRALSTHGTDDQVVHIATSRSGAIFRGTVFKTTNGGTNWTALSPIIVPENQAAGALRAIDVLPTGEIWTTGGIGFIFASSVPGRATPAELTDFAILDGTLISGGLPELASSDDTYLETEARVTGEVAQPHLMRMRIGATTTVQNPSTIDLTLESHITDVEASAWLFLRDWNTRRWVQVDQFAVGMQDEIHQVTVPNAGRFVRASDGRIALRIKKIVFFPFTLGGFHSLIDQLEIGVR